MGDYEDDTTVPNELFEQPGDLALDVPGLAAGVTDDDPTQITIIQQDPATAESGTGDGNSAGDAGEDFGARSPVDDRK